MIHLYAVLERIPSRAKNLLLTLMVLLPLNLMAEGTRQVAPNSTDITMLITGRPDFSNFAAFNGPETSRLYFTINNANEIVYLGLSGEYTEEGELISSLPNSRYRFRIRRASDGAVVHGPFLIDRDNANVTDWSDAVFGSYPTDAMLPNENTNTPEKAFEFAPGAAGDYFIEFQDYLFDGNAKVLIGYWDITVAEGQTVQDGRLWSRNWAFRTPTLNKNDPEECDWDRPFNGTLFSYTTDGFVSKIDFMDSGFQGLAFTVAFNQAGPGISGDIETDRQSVPGANATANSAEHRIFINEPCAICFPDGECGTVSGADNISCNDSGDFCLTATVTRVGQVEVILDFNQNGEFDPDSEDVLLVYCFDDPDNLTVCIPWDGIKGDGSPIEFGDLVDIIYVYTQGVQHWSVYDGEFMKGGFCVEAVRPICRDPETEDITNILYWDDRNIPEDPGTGQPKDGRGGCTCGDSNCRTWTFFEPNQSCESLNDNLTEGYGDKSTLNTWWFANVTKVISRNVPILTCQITGNQEICDGDVSEFTVEVSPSQGSYTYQWSGPAGFTGLNSPSTGPIGIAGTYCVTITDEQGCQTSCCLELTVLESPQLQCTPTPVTCNGSEDGQIVAVASGGLAPYVFTIDGFNFQPSGTFTDLAPGEYTITVRDDQGCTNSCTTRVIEPPVLTCTVDLVQNVSCNGGADGSATANPNGGAPAIAPYNFFLDRIRFPKKVPKSNEKSLLLLEDYTYLWDNGETTQTATMLDAGPHSVTITDINGCISVCGITIFEPDPLTCTTTLVANVSCKDGSDGSATATPDGGTAPYAFLWDNGETTATATMLDAGTHTVTVTDAKRCTTQCTVDITEPEALTCSTSVVSQVSCNGESDGSATATPNGGTAPYTFLWNNGETTATATMLDAGTHTVTVTDANRCTTQCTVDITEPEVLTCSITVVSQVSCNGESDGSATATPDGGTAPYTFLWDNGETTATATMLDAGTHTVTVTDANQCTTQCTVDITEPEALTCSITVVSQVSCNGESDGSATATPNGGTGPYTFLWDNGETTATAIMLDAGTHSVTVTDANRCTTECTVDITEPEALSCSITIVSQITCNGGNDGSATVTPAGGTGPFTYLWDNGETTATATRLNAGPHTVTVTDANGCTTDCSVTLTEPEILSCNARTIQNVTCYGDADGIASVTAGGGTSPYSFLWSDGQTNPTASGLIAGVYNVTVSDANGCSTVCAVRIDEGPELTCTITSFMNVSCFGGDDGQATVIPAGGTPPYSFLWNNGQTTNIVTGLSAGEASVTITDQAGCTTTCFVKITEPERLTCEITNVTPENCEGSNDGGAIVIPDGGTTPYTYRWDNGETTPAATMLSAGMHRVTVTDAEGCQTFCSVTIGLLNNLVCEAKLVSGVSCKGGSDGSATVFPSDGTPQYFYLWDNGETNKTATMLDAGVHTVTVTDSKGCTTTCSVMVPQPPLLYCKTEKIKDASCYGGADGSARASGLGGTPPYSYRWDNGETTQTATRLDAGLHTVTVTDANRCVTTCSVRIEEPQLKLLCPPMLDLECDDPQLDQKIEDWLDAIIVENACEELPVDNDYDVDNFEGDCLLRQTVTFTLRIDGITLTCTSRIVIRDTKAPIVSCPPEIVLQCNDPLPPKDFAGGKVEDNCAPPEKIKVEWIRDESNYGSGCVDDPLIYKRYYRVSDNCDNSTICVQTIRYEPDTEPPVLMPVHPELAKIELGDTIIFDRCYLEENEWNPFIFRAEDMKATDNCSAVEVKLEDYYLYGNCDAGEFQSFWICRWYAIDDCGNKGEFYFYMGFLDTEPPEILNPITPELSAECDKIPPPMKYIDVWDGCSSPDYRFEEEIVPGDCAGNYDIIRRYIPYDNCGNVGKTKQQVIHVTDTRGPKLYFSQPPLSGLRSGETYQTDCEGFNELISNLDLITAEDNCDEKPKVSVDYTETPADCNWQGYFRKAVVTWTAADQCGNTSTFVLNITVEDNTAPDISFTQKGMEGLESGDSFEMDCQMLDALLADAESFATITDACDPNPKVKVDTKMKWNEWGCGSNGYLSEWQITWTATDACGNKSTFLLNAIGVDKTPPTIHNVPENTCFDGSLPAPPANIIATDNCSEAQVRYKQEGPRYCQDGGVYYLRIWTATDACGNVAEATQVLTTNDRRPPKITIGHPAFYRKPSGSEVTLNADCSRDHGLPDLNIRIEDNCYDDLPYSMTVEPLASGDCMTTGYMSRLRVTISARDACGNADQFVATINLVDKEPPRFTDFPDRVTVGCNGPFPVVTAEDDCGPVSLRIISTTPSQDPCSPSVYRIIRTWEAADACGNTVTRDQWLYIDHSISIAGDFEKQPEAKAPQSGKRLPGRINKYAIRAFPNPASASVSIDLSTLAGKSSIIRIVNLVGQPVFSTEFDETPATPFQVNLEGYNSGVYNIIVRTSDGEVSTKQFIVQKL